MKDYYQILDVSRSASETEIHKAYTKSCAKYKSKPEFYKEILSAIDESYLVLSNEIKKKEYDVQYFLQFVKEGKTPQQVFIPKEEKPKPKIEAPPKKEIIVQKPIQKSEVKKERLAPLPLYIPKENKKVVAPVEPELDVAIIKRKYDGKIHKGNDEFVLDESKIKWSIFAITGILLLGIGLWAVTGLFSGNNSSQEVPTSKVLPISDESISDALIISDSDQATMALDENVELIDDEENPEVDGPIDEPIEEEDGPAESSNQQQNNTEDSSLKPSNETSTPAPNDESIAVKQVTTNKLENTKTIDPEDYVSAPFIKDKEEEVAVENEIKDSVNVAKNVSNIDDNSVAEEILESNASNIPSSVETTENLIAEVNQIMPEFNGGEVKMYQFIQKNLKYPKNALDQEIEGLVIVSFEVDTSGKIVNPIVTRDIGAGCGKEALRIVRKMPKWTPAKHNGNIVPMKVSLPIKFKILEG